MTDQPPLDPTSRPAAEATPGSQFAAASPTADYPPSSSRPSIIERPEVRIAGTFVGGLLAATVLKRFAR